MIKSLLHIDIHDACDVSVPLCPYCRQTSTCFKVVTVWEQRKGIAPYAACAICNNCGKGIIIDCDGQMLTADSDSWQPVSFSISTIYDYFPKISFNPPDNVPEDIGCLFAKADEDAHKTTLDIPQAVCNANAKAAVVECRMVLEQTIKTVMPDCDEGSSLYKNIQKVIESRHLQNILSDWLNTIRCFGNTGAHEVDEVSPQDAVNAVNFTGMLLWYLFTVPAKIEKKRKQQ